MTPEEKAKETIMREWNFTEVEYEEHREQIEDTMKYGILMIRYHLHELIGEIKKTLP